MTDRYADLEKLARAATPGPWKPVSDLPMYAVWSVPAQRDVVCSERRKYCAPSQYDAGILESDANYIAAVSPDVILKLIADLKVMRGALTQISDGLSERDMTVCPVCINTVLGIARAALQEVSGE